ncbi:uncharacterized protein LTR77_011248 [Saxophila tyrrhenica]|uniref:Uncharacterized protein n=1 Tax=Saxophila tyrrhenica TaxID=1690608 RepID=A0AAV9NWG9_9PEZI|nr:hypothetical protein LTR77_011248 [Saxophila tyrrhenica]
MYSAWNYDETNVNANRPKAVVGRAQQERDRKTNAIELTNNIRRQFESELPPIAASELLSMAFRQRGIPCMDMFTYLVVGKFRTGLGHDAHVDGHERKFMPLIRWECPDVVGTLWTIEPVASSFIMRGNSTDCETALRTYEGELEVIDAMSMTTTATSARMGNELRGRWAGWILSRAAADDGGYTDSVCVSCNMSSSLFAFSTQIKGGNLIHFAMTAETVTLVATYAKTMQSSLGVTASLRLDESTKLKVQPRASTNRSTCLRLFGNGSMQICGSPTDIELLVSATFSISRNTTPMLPSVLIGILFLISMVPTYDSLTAVRHVDMFLL